MSHCRKLAHFAYPEAPEVQAQAMKFPSALARAGALWTVLIALGAPLALLAADGGGKDPSAGSSVAGAPIVVGVIDDEIGHATSAYLTRLLEAVRSQKAQALVIEINTLGGRVDAAVAIRDALLDAPVTKVAFIK